MKIREPHIREHLPEVKIRVVNVVDLMKLQSSSEHPHGLNDMDYNSIFTKDIIFNFHGHSWLVHRFTYRRTNQNLQARGYKEEGTFTTPFDLNDKQKRKHYQSLLNQKKMSTKKKLGIWMDHAHAHLIEYVDPMVTTDVTSSFTYDEKEKTLLKSERMVHNKEQHEESEYYKAIGEAIKKYDEVLLFGPTDAKVELLNILEADHSFSKIKIEIKQTDKMSENQEQAFVRDYFSKG